MLGTTWLTIQASMSPDELSPHSVSVLRGVFPLGSTTIVGGMTPVPII